jgi:hypothetical protein
METTQRIALHSYPYLKLAKMPWFCLNKIREQEGVTDSAWMGLGESENSHFT